MRIVVLSALLLATLTACAGPSVVPGHNPMGYDSRKARLAIGGEDTPVVILGQPFPGADPAEVSRMVASALSNAAPQLETRFYPADARTAALKPASVVIAFNPAGNVLPSNLCGLSTLPSDPARRPMLLDAAFCTPGARTTSQGWLTKAEGLSDPNVAAWVHNTVATLFPTNLCVGTPCW
jgi:hypothetical protein